MKRRLFLVSMLILAVFSAAWAQQKEIRGRVTDTQGNPLPASTIQIVGTTRGTTADANGDFEISAAPGQVLEISSIGYLKQTVTASAENKMGNIMLKQSANLLNETVVTALGISKKERALGYAVSTVTSKEITRAQSTNFATALYGKLAGVRIASSPGGATSAAFIQVRGLGSITGNTQPLIVLDGVPIRNGQVSNSNYWGDQRIRGNGLLDINPEDIESISVLKGASAAALYGSEAANGVVLITTKKGEGKGFKVSFNASYSEGKMAYYPKLQNEYGPGYSKQVNDAGQDDNLWLHKTVNGQSVRFPIGTSLNFGPKFDGQPTLAWDGKMHPYLPQKNNFDALYQTPHSSIASIKITNVTDKTNVRFDFTRQDNTMLSLGSKNQKNIADFNTDFNLSKFLQTSLMIDYINERTDNRPYMIDRMINNFGGMMGRFDNAKWYLDKYKTSLGYYYVAGNGTSLTPDENIKYPGYRGDVLDYLWRVNENNSIEMSNRLISSWKNTITPFKGLNLNTQIAIDYTGGVSEDKQHSTIPLAYGYSGYYAEGASMDLWTYGQMMLNYNFKATKNLEFNISAGYNARKEQHRSSGSATNGGLREENFFNLAASVNTPTGSSNVTEFLTDGLFGIMDVSYKDYLFLEATGRRDRTSTMASGNNTYFYPSVNASFVFSDAFKMPSFISFGKIRASYGIVGNYPALYQANRAYSLGRLASSWRYGSVLYTTVNTNANDQIAAEQKKEVELGLETRLFKNRLGVEINYYNGKVVNQIVPISLPASSGGGSKLANVGTLSNSGLELILNATPVHTRNFSWDINFNIARNKNKVVKLAPGLNTLVTGDGDGNAYEVVSRVGHPVGDILVHPLEVLNGKPIIDQSADPTAGGLYIVNPDSMVLAGNTRPKAWGGISNMFTYKGFTLNMTADFQVGGVVMPTGYFWMVGRGLMAETLQWRDEAHGGLAYYVDANGTRVKASGSAGPNGEKVYHDGLILDGVTPNGKPNSKIASAEEYWWVTYNWGGPQYSPNTRYDLYARKNNYLKVRELSLGYDLPRNLISKIGAGSLNISVFGRNLFYIYRTIKFIDPEILTGGSNWSQDINNMGESYSTRTFGVMIRAEF